MAEKPSFMNGFKVIVVKIHSEKYSIQYTISIPHSFMTLDQLVTHPNMGNFFIVLNTTHHTIYTHDVSKGDVFFLCTPEK